MLMDDTQKTTAPGVAEKTVRRRTQVAVRRARTYSAAFAAFMSAVFCPLHGALYDWSNHEYCMVVFLPLEDGACSGSGQSMLLRRGSAADFVVPVWRMIYYIYLFYRQTEGPTSNVPLARVAAIIADSHSGWSQAVAKREVTR